MKRLISIFSVVILGALFFVTPVKAENAPIWNLTGNHVLSMVCINGCTSANPFTMDITSMDMVTGDFSGTGYFVPHPMYHWDITGNVSGSKFTMTVVYTRFPDTYYFHGTVDRSGVISGMARGDEQVLSWTTSLVANLPTDKTQCEDGGWQAFNNPTFKNEGICVSYLDRN